MANILIGIIGLPSAGKSSLVNSLAGRRILRTGVCRTTREVRLIGSNNRFGFPEDRFHQVQLKSDDGIDYDLLDLPGICDAEDQKSGGAHSFDELTQAWVTKCDVVIWVSDIKTAFLTSHEKAEYEKIVAELYSVRGSWGESSFAAKRFADDATSPKKNDSSFLEGI